MVNLVRDEVYISIGMLIVSSRVLTKSNAPKPAKCVFQAFFGIIKQHNLYKEKWI